MRANYELVILDAEIVARDLESFARLVSHLHVRR